MLTWFKVSPQVPGLHMGQQRWPVTVGMFQGILGELQVWSVRGTQGTLAAVWPLSHCSPIEPHQEARQEVHRGLTPLPNSRGGAATAVKRHRAERERQADRP